jgi:hypothetical protein
MISTCRGRIRPEVKSPFDNLQGRIQRCPLGGGQGVGFEEGVPLPKWGGIGEGTVPPSQEKNEFFHLKWCDLVPHE